MKKIFSLSLALAMALTLTVPVLADDEELPAPPEQEITEEIPQPEISDEGQDAEPEQEQEPAAALEPDAPEEDSQENEDSEEEEDSEEGGETAPSEDLQPADDSLIEVVVPAIGEVIINPYGVSVATDTGETCDQIIHQAQPITNYSDFPVGINATVVGEIAADSAARFVTAAPSPDGQEKEVFMYAEFQPSADSWSGSYTDAPNQVVVTSEGSTREGVLTLDAQSEGYFRLFGAMAADVDPMWSSDDAITVTLSYTFTKAAPEPADPVETDSALEPGETMEPEDFTESEQPAEPEESAELEAPVEPEDFTEFEQPAEPEDFTEFEQPVEPEDFTDFEQPVVVEDETTPPPGTPLPLDIVLEEIENEQII